MKITKSNYIWNKLFGLSFDIAKFEIFGFAILNVFLVGFIVKLFNFGSATS